MILGLLPAFRRSGSATAIVSWIAGIATFAYTRYAMSPSMTVTVAAPAAVSAIVFIGGGFLESSTSQRAAGLFSALAGGAHDD
jgi:SSS family solute:Na+ symporter